MEIEERFSTDESCLVPVMVKRKQHKPQWWPVTAVYDHLLLFTYAWLINTYRYTFKFRSQEHRILFYRINLKQLHRVCLRYINIFHLTIAHTYSALVYHQELLSEQNIPKVSITASHKVQIVQRQLLQKILPLMTNRESLFQQCQPISYSLAQKLLLSSYKLHSAFGCWDPIKVGIVIDKPNSCQIPLTVFVNIVCFSTHLPSLQQYKEPDLIQPLPWPLNSSYPLIFHQYIYFFTSKENRNAFMLNPLKYLRQPKPNPYLPFKMAVVGPPKSGKTTGKDQDSNPYCCMFSNVLYSV